MTTAVPGSDRSDAGPAAAPPVIDTPEARDQLDCPLCGYSLRGLSTSYLTADADTRCPECGYPFSWEQVLRSRQHRHAYLFEHQRGLRGFVATLLAGLRPRRFWSSLNAGHQIRPARLVLFALLTATLTATSVLGGLYVGTLITNFRRHFAYRTFRDDVSVLVDPAFWQEALDDSHDNGDLILFLTGACVAWPWITLAALLIFQTSMRRARVREQHLLRCVVYSGDALVWTGIGLLAGGLIGVLPRFPDYYGAVRPIVASVLPAIFLATYRLGVAYQRYLRFQHAWSTVFMSQVIFLLVVTTILALFYEGFFRLFW